MPVPEAWLRRRREWLFLPPAPWHTDLHTGLFAGKRSENGIPSWRGCNSSMLIWLGDDRPLRGLQWQLPDNGSEEVLCRFQGVAREGGAMRRSRTPSMMRKCRSLVFQIKFHPTPFASAPGCGVAPHGCCNVIEIINMINQLIPKFVWKRGAGRCLYRFFLFELNGYCRLRWAQPA